MTYAQFLLVFVVPMIVLLAIIVWRRRLFTRRLALALVLTSAIAVVYTGPWDSLIISQGVWYYLPERVLGPTIGLVPIEEYSFFVLQVLMTGLLVRALTVGKVRERSSWQGGNGNGPDNR